MPGTNSNDNLFCVITVFPRPYQSQPPKQRKSKHLELELTERGELGVTAFIPQ